METIEEANNTLNTCTHKYQCNVVLISIGLRLHYLLIFLSSVFWHLGASCRPRTWEGFLPAGDPETGATTEEPTEASGQLWAKKPRGNRRKLRFLPEDQAAKETCGFFFLSITLLLHGVQEQNNGADRITCLASKLTLKTNELQQYFVFCKMRNR